MEQSPQAPIFVFDKKTAFLSDVLVSVEEAAEYLLDVAEGEDGSTARADEFDYFDAAGRRLQPSGGTLSVPDPAVTPEDHCDLVRERVRVTLQAIEPEFLGDPSFDSLREIVDRDVDFAVFARSLAEALRQPLTVATTEGTTFVRFHRGSPFHNIGHMVRRRRR